MKTATTATKQTEQLADDLGLLLARYYIAFEKAIRDSLPERRKLKRRAVSMFAGMTAPEIRSYLKSNRALVAQGFREALTGPLRKEAKKLLGFTDFDFDHIARTTPGNPDIGVGGISQSTGNGNTLYGPAVTVTEGHITMKLGAGVEVATPAQAPELSLAGIRDAAGNAVKGVGVAIGIQIDC